MNRWNMQETGKKRATPLEQPLPSRLRRAKRANYLINQNL